MNPFVAIVWWISLLGAVLAFLPNLVSWLIRARAAARHIELYSEEILRAGAGIAENTSKATALKQTLSLAPQLVSGAQSMESHLAALQDALAARPARPPENAEEGQQ